MTVITGIEMEDSRDVWVEITREQLERFCELEGDRKDELVAAVLNGGEAQVKGYGVRAVLTEI